MERLTEKHYLAEDHYMKCSGTCHGDMDCIDCPAFDQFVERLAAYEDIAELCGGFDRLRELAEADKDGRVVVLPCKGYSSIDIARDGVSYRPDHWNIYLTAYAHGQNTPSGLKVGLFDIGEVERAMQEMEGKKDGKT